MIKAIIFDLDGTLLDTSRDIHKVLNETLSRFNLPEITVEKTMQYVGNGARKLIERAVGENRKDLWEDVYKDYSVAFANCDNKLTKLYDGEREALEAFTAAGIKLAIITNKPKAATEHVFNEYLANFGFCKVLCQTEQFPLKPNPASTLHVLESFKVKKDECIFVGDGDTDVNCAANAGIKCVSALWGYRSKNQLEAAGASHFAENFANLEKLVFGY